MGTHVWLVEAQWDRETSEVLAIYATEEAANADLPMLKKTRGKGADVFVDSYPLLGLPLSSDFYEI